MDDDGAHADSLHEDDIGKDFAELLVGVHEGAAEFDDDDFLVEALDVLKGFDEGVGFFDDDITHGQRRGLGGGAHGKSLQADGLWCFP